jgi:LuxR family maltose regulon positive regulatory protein
MKNKNQDTDLKEQILPHYKLFPPQVSSTSIQRQYLLSELTSQNQYSAVVIQAPAGHGKTTLMRQLKEKFDESGFSTGWLSLDDNDNDISQFNAYFRSLVKFVLKVNRTKPIPHKIKSGSGSVEDILQLLSLIEGPAALFIDEFQVITEKVNIALLETIIERCPPNICFYIGSRAIPDMAKGRLLIGGQIRWVAPEDLCFSIDEVDEFLYLVGLDVSKEEADAFLDQTGGWPAILQLLHLALKGGQVNKNTLFSWIKGCGTQLANYLADNVMQNQPVEIQDFLLKTSLLKRVSAPLCEAITRYPDAESKLKIIVEQGLFIQHIDFEQQWFQYHSIFSSYLQDQLQKQSPEHVELIHREAALWFKQNNYLEESIEQSILAGDYSKAADTLSQWIPDLVCSARLQTLELLCKKIPDSAYFNRPFLCWGRIWAQFFLSQKQEACENLQAFEKMTPHKNTSQTLIQSISILNSIKFLFEDNIIGLEKRLDTIQLDEAGTETYHYFELGVLANLHAISSMQNLRFENTKKYAIEGESMSMKGNAAFSSAYSTSLLALALINEGNPKLALKKLKSRLDNRELKIQGSFATASLSAIYGMALYETGNFIEAETHLSDTIDVISETLPSDWVILATLSLFRARSRVEGNTIFSMDLLDKAEQSAQFFEKTRLLQSITIERFRVSLCNSTDYSTKIEPDLPLINDPEKIKKHFLSEGTHDLLIHTIRYHIVNRNFELAFDIIKKSINSSITSNWIRRLIKLYTLQSIAYHKAGNTELSSKSILQAISLCSKEFLVSNFIEEGPYCLNIIKKVIESNKSKDHKLQEIVQKLDLSDIPVTDNNEKDQDREKLIEQLTKREMDILKLVAQGSSNTEISGALYISYNTVKFHMKNLYGKLGAKNRINLISEAEKHKLI